MGKNILIVMVLILSWHPLYAQDDTIYVVQPKTTALASRFETVLSAAYNLNNRWVGEAGTQLAVLYHVRENIAVEVQGAWFVWRYNSSFYSQLQGLGAGYMPPLVEFYRVPWLINAALQWSPIYGKLSFHDVMLGDIGVYVIAGAGLVGLELANPAGSSAAQPIFSGNGILPVQLTTPFGAGVRLHFSNHFGLRLEVRDNVQALWNRQANTYPSSFNISHKVWLALGVSYVF